MAKYTDPNVPCKNCGQFVANHSWTEPERKADETEAAFQKRRNAAQENRGANLDPNVKCSEYEPKA